MGGKEQEGECVAKDDFSVIACIILSYLYECLKKGRAVNTEYLTHEYFRVNEGYFQFILEELYRAGYIEGCLTPEWKDGNCIVLTDDVRITMAGITYLEESSLMAKARAALPEWRGWFGTLLQVLGLALRG